MYATSTPPAKPRIRWYWRVLVVQVWLAACFLYLVLAGAGVVLLLSGFDAGLAPSERLLALAGATLILLLCLHILRMALPRVWPSRLRRV